MPLGVTQRAVLSSGPAIPDEAILQVDPTQSFSSGDDGTTISTIPDEIGTLDLSNDSGGATVVENGINGVRSMDFDRTDEYSVSFSTISQPTTIFIVVQYQDTSEHEVIGGDTSDNDQILQGHVNGNDRIFAGNTLSDGASDQNPHLFTLIFDGQNSIIHKDGQQVGSGNAGSKPLDGLRVGDAAEFSTNTNALIGEILPCSKRLSTTVIDGQEQRIASKYGITLA